MRRYDLAVFDLDGTLLDTRGGVLSAVKYTIKEFGYEMPDEETLRSFIGPPVQEGFSRVYGLEGPILQEIATVFRNFYSTNTLLEAELYEGMTELMEEMLARGIKPAVATYKREDYALKLLRHFGFDHYTDIMFGGDHENKLKKRDIIEKCINTAGVTDLSRVVMIGDTEFDAVGARDIGVDFIGVSYGFGYKSVEEIEGKGAAGAARTPLDILRFF